ncbi:uncharacterized protein PAC_14250 [Phialocephala subalpina]|uniref:Extracellular serine-rich protein n=1 Tax=Phialocephala subalpina TaxID=576137 RepID=A0A1L7XH51_9HELO|nr:uncharacterized protein PAC_14250 [Phialocephala subalpina]
MQHSNPLLLVLFLISIVSSLTTRINQPSRIRIDIGSNGAPALVFTPDSIKAQVGDTLDFHFIDQNVVSSVLLGVENSPCTPAPAGADFFNSGPILGDPDGTNVFSVNVTSDSQMILYCGVGAHCQAGMVAVVNPDKLTTLKGYAKAATGVQMNLGPPNMTGGSFTQGTSGGPVIIGFAPGAGPQKSAAGPCVGTSRRAVGGGSCVARK